MNLPKVFIIILNWNGLQNTLECLESVFKLNYENFEVVVVDNGSSDDSVATIRRNYPQIILLENRENLGYTVGNNIGMRYAIENGGDYVWLLNNDTFVEENTLKKLIATGEKAHNIGLVSPVIYDYDLPEKIQFSGSVIDWATHSLIFPDHKHLDIDKDFVSGKNVCLWGTALLVKSDVIKRIGYLEEKFFAYYEDTDYSIKSIRSGFQNLLELDARIYHKIDQSRKPHVFYFLSRNEWFFWVQKLRGLEKILYYRQYFANRLSRHAALRNSGYDECADAVLDGIWAAITDVGGGWDTYVRMPYLLKKVFLWHPYFWSRLFGGLFLKNFLKFLKEQKDAFTK